MKMLLTLGLAVILSTTMASYSPLLAQSSEESSSESSSDQSAPPDNQADTANESTNNSQTSSENARSNSSAETGESQQSATSSSQSHDDADQTTRSSNDLQSSGSASQDNSAQSRSAPGSANRARSDQAYRNQRSSSQNPARSGAQTSGSSAINQAAASPGGPALTSPQPHGGPANQPQFNSSHASNQLENQAQDAAQQSILQQRPDLQQNGQQLSNQQLDAQQHFDQQQSNQDRNQQQFDSRQFDQQQLNDQQLNQQRANSQQLDTQQSNSQRFSNEQFQTEQFSTQQFDSQQVDQQLGIQFQAPGQIAGHGLAISAIQPGSVFFDSGLRQGDTLVSIDNRPIASQSEFVQIIRSYPNDRIPLIVMRDGRQQTIFVERPERWSVVTQASPVQLSQAVLGVSFDSNITNAAIIQNVTPGGPAQLAGLRTGDQITALNGQQVSSPHEATQMISSMAPGQEVIIDYSRQQMSVRTQAVLVPRNFDRVEHSVGYAPQQEAPGVAPAPAPTRERTYVPQNRRIEYQDARPWRPLGRRYRSR